MAVFLHPDSIPHRLLTEFARYFVPRPLAPIVARLRDRHVDRRRLSDALSSLKDRGLLALDDASGTGTATPRGRKLLALARLPRLDARPSPRRDLLVTYDIPRTRNFDRDLFRGHLRRLGFVGLHHSAWVGPATMLPLISDYVREEGLTPLVHWAPWRRTQPRAAAAAATPTTRRKA